MEQDPLLSPQLIDSRAPLNVVVLQPAEIKSEGRNLVPQVSRLGGRRQVAHDLQHSTQGLEHTSMSRQKRRTGVGDRDLQQLQDLRGRPLLSGLRLRAKEGGVLENDFVEEDACAQPN